MTKNIWAVGRNYSDHAKELGNPLPEQPLFFLKSGSCIQTGPVIRLLPQLEDVHFEAELALKIDSQFGFSHMTLALDLTDRAAQTRAKQEGLPWTRAKSFRGACVLADWVPFNNSSGFFGQSLQLSVNGALRQKAFLSEMIFKPDFLIKTLIETFPVEEGDILLTGTPSGVGALRSGDKVNGRIGDSSTISCEAAWEVALF